MSLLQLQGKTFEFRNLKRLRVWFFCQYFLLRFFSTWISISNTAILCLKLQVFLSRHCKYYTDWFQELLTGYIYMVILIPCLYSNSHRLIIDINILLQISVLKWAYSLIQYLEFGKLSRLQCKRLNESAYEKSKR